MLLVAKQIDVMSRTANELSVVTRLEDQGQDLWRLALALCEWQPLQRVCRAMMFGCTVPLLPLTRI